MKVVRDSKLLQQIATDVAVIKSRLGFNAELADDECFFCGKLGLHDPLLCYMRTQYPEGKK